LRENDIDQENRYWEGGRSGKLGVLAVFALICEFDTVTLFVAFKADKASPHNELWGVDRAKHYNNSWGVRPLSRPKLLQG